MKGFLFVLFLITKVRQGTERDRQKCEVEETVAKPTWLEWTAREGERCGLDVNRAAERARLLGWGFWEQDFIVGEKQAWSADAGLPGTARQDTRHSLLPRCQGGLWPVPVRRERKKWGQRSAEKW